MIEQKLKGHYQDDHESSEDEPACSKVDDHITKILSTRNQPKKCMSIHLKPGISKLNFFSFLVTQFVTFTSISVILSLVTFILVNGYHIP